MKYLGHVVIITFLIFGLYSCGSFFGDCYSRGGRIVKNMYGIFECIEARP